MESVLFVVGVFLLYGVLYWYIVIYSARKHLREAVKETDAVLGYRQGRPPPPPIEIRWVGELQRINPQPGEVFALMTEQHIDDETAKRLRVGLSEALGGAKCIVLSDGLRLEVAKPDAAERA